MKTLVRIVIVATVAAAFVFSVNAADPKAPKGKGPVVVPGENFLMTCPKCKDDHAVKPNHRKEPSQRKPSSARTSARGAARSW